MCRNRLGTTTLEKKYLYSLKSLFYQLSCNTKRIRDILRQKNQKKYVFICLFVDPILLTYICKRKFLYCTIFNILPLNIFIKHFAQSNSFDPPSCKQRFCANSNTTKMIEFFLLEKNKSKIKQGNSLYLQKEVCSLM